MNKPADKIIAMGEIMLRLTPPDYGKIEQATSYLANYGGGEANVAVSLSHLGHNCYFLTKLPPNELGDGAVSHLLSHGIKTDYIVRGSSTMGFYFLENGFGGRPGKVIYNRKHSAATRMDASEFNLDEIFSDATWFHLSGITLALSERTRACALEALKAAKKYKVKVSFDFNYRSKLWTIEEARKFYPAVMPYVDVLFASPFDFRQILQFESDNTDDVQLMKDALKHYNLDYIFGKTRTIISATENEMKAYVYSKDGKVDYTDQCRFQIFDRIGAGDAFAAGVIDGLTSDYASRKKAAELGLSNCILKQTIFGDVSTFSESDLQEYIRSQGVTEVKR
jgi:2-dehydro-3-deoxygluconokinase